MKPIIVAEIGINHNGSLETAKQLIDVAVENKVDYVKFQKRTVEKVYSKEELDKPRESPWGNTNRDQKLGLEFEKSEYDEIDRYCKERSIGWFASPWDIDSVDFIMQYQPKFIKVASASVTDINLLKYIRKAINGTNTKVILATGMSDRIQVDCAIDILDVCNIAYVLVCTSSYPTPAEDMCLSRITYYQADYTMPFVGFSNHYQGLAGIFAAISLGARMVEYHITLDRAMYGSDQAASIEPQGVKRICDFVEFMAVAMGDWQMGCRPSEKLVATKLRANQ